MTCIIGIVEKDKIYMGADSLGSASTWCKTRKDKKICIKKSVDDIEFIIGYTSSYRMGQLLRYNLQIPRVDKLELHEYMVTKFIPAIRECFKDGGYARKKDDEEKGGQFLVGVKNRLFQIECDYQVGESVHNYDSVGCGFELALGSLFSTADIEAPENRINIALEAAEEFSNGVRKSFNIMSIG